MKKLWLSNNIVERLEPFSFSETKCLEGIRLGSNEIFFVSKNAFHGLNSLKKLDLQKNSIKLFNEGTFHELINLKELRLNSNLIAVLKQGLFDGNLKLKKIFLQNNKITKIDSKLFLNHKQLIEVNLEHNSCINTLFSEATDNFNDLGNEINAKCSETKNLGSEKELEVCNMLLNLCKIDVTDSVKQLGECQKRQEQSK